VRIRRGRPVLLGRHVERLEHSSLALRLPTPDGAAELARFAAEAAGVDDGSLRLFRTMLTLVATVASLPEDYDAMRKRGIALITIPARGGGLLRGVKATSYAVNMAAVAEAERRGADDALFLDKGEIVLEATTANVWWRADDVLSTPAVSTGVLPGVTRGAVMRLAGEAGLRVREGAFTLPQLLRAEEVFTSSAVREIMPVIAVDGRELSRGDAAPRLQALLEQIGE
jgi:branched-subunit amino acid aminotransferase/4-amino-4-deoxychorismate lyase